MFIRLDTVNLFVVPDTYCDGPYFVLHTNIIRIKKLGMICTFFFVIWFKKIILQQNIIE